MAGGDNSMSPAAMTFMVMGYFATFGLFVSHLWKVYGIWRDSQIGNTKIHPFCFVLLNSFVWVLYGALDWNHDGWAVVVINVIGMVAMVICIGIFLRFDDNGRATHSIILAVEVALVVMFAVVIFLTQPVSGKKDAFVVYGCVTGVLMYLVSVLTDLVVWSQAQAEQGQEGVEGWEGMLVLVASMLNGICWLLYGILHGGPFVTIGNSIGLGFCVLQLGILGCIKCGNLNLGAVYNYVWPPAVEYQPIDQQEVDQQGNNEEEEQLE